MNSKEMCDHELWNLQRSYECVMRNEFKKMQNNGFQVSCDSDINLLLENIAEKIARIVLNKPTIEDKEETDFQIFKTKLYLKDIENINSLRDIKIFDFD